MSVVSVAVAVAVGFLACAIVVTNNLRDIPSDAIAAKRTLAVRIGDHASAGATSRCSWGRSWSQRWSRY